MEASPAPQAQGSLGPSLAPELRYGDSSAMGLPSVRTLREFQAMNQSDFTQANNVIRIRVASQEFLALEEAVISWDFTNTSTGSAFLDGGIGGAISMLRILSMQGVELERLEGYGLLNAIELQYKSTDSELREQAVMAGTPGAIDPVDPYPSKNDDTEQLEKAMNSGFRPKRCDRLDNGIKRHYEFRLRGGWFNTDLKKLLPPDTHFEIELTLSSADEFMVDYKQSGMIQVLTGLAEDDHLVTVNPHGFAVGDKFVLYRGDEEGTLAGAVGLKASGVGGTTTKLGDRAIYVANTGTTGSILKISDSLTATGDSVTWTGSLANPTKYHVRAITGPAVSYKIQNVILKVPAIRVEDPGFKQRVQGLKERGYIWTASTYKRYISVVDNNVGEQTFQISDRSNSLDAFIHVIRRNQHMTNTTRFQNCVRSIGYVEEYQMQIGSQLYPPAKIKVGTTTMPSGLPLIDHDTNNLNINDAFAEAKRVFGFNRGVITAENFGQSEDNDGCGVLCVSTRSYEENSRMLSGIDTKSQALPITLKIKTKQGINSPITSTVGGTATTFGDDGQNGVLHTYAKCAVMFSMQPGTGMLEAAT